MDFKNVINMEIDVVCRICLTQNSLMENLFELKLKSDLIVRDKILEFCSIQASRKKSKISKYDNYNKKHQYLR
jgi:hypothetical protein